LRPQSGNLTSYLMKHRKGKKTTRKISEALGIALAAWFLVVLIYRVIPPPGTPLMLIRIIQSKLTSGSGFRSWKWVSLRELPAYVPQAIVTAEDARFMSHWGVDFGAVGDALDAASGRAKLRGASTITMQTVKNLFLWPGRSYLRKALEWCMAPVAGVVWGKRRTLELYINVIEWGQGVYGLESAARHYFKKGAGHLSIAEAAALAAILPNPRKLSPIKMVHSTKRRYERILRESAGTRMP
jgi:monofunctional biosynthetic peptidoglycan transglycosylase